jgi:DUF971 family protein
VARANFESSESPRPKEIGAEERELEILWTDGSRTSLPFDYLRNQCPCAVCVDEWTGKRRRPILLLDSNFGPTAIDPVGNYAIQISWSDGHNSGIYSFRYLQELAEQRAQPKA